MPSTFPPSARFIALQKWIGESEKLVRALFAVARAKQPSVIFMDEVDSLLTSRGDGEHEASRRLKTEFLVQLDGAGTRSTDFVLVIGATNRPQELDEAARRRFTRRIYVSLPDPPTRLQMLDKLLLREPTHALAPEHKAAIVAATEGYSGADIAQVCAEAARLPLRRKAQERGGDLRGVCKADLDPITIDDFTWAMSAVKSSVAPSEITHYLEWNDKFGSKGQPKLAAAAGGSAPAAVGSSGGTGAGAGPSA